jgi:hypothetical protein
MKVYCQRLHETDDAVKIQVQRGDNDWFMMWLPLSQVSSMHFNKQEQGYLVVEDWLGKKKGLEGTEKWEDAQETEGDSTELFDKLNKR